MIIKATKKIINISDSEIISDGKRHAEIFRVKDMSIRGKTLLKIKNTSHIIAVRGLTNRVPELKLKLKLLKL